MSKTILVGLGSGVIGTCVIWLLLAALGRINIGVSREVIVGVVAGILTTGFLSLGGTLFGTIILPWYHESSYKGLDLSGSWRIRLGDGGVNSDDHLELTADLKQVTDRVSGVLVVVAKGRSGQPLTYNLSGSRREQFLAITIEKIGRKQFGVGTSLVQVIDVGNRLRGYLCAYDSGSGGIRCDSCEWQRAEEAASDTTAPSRP